MGLNLAPQPEQFEPQQPKSSSTVISRKDSGTNFLSPVTGENISKEDYEQEIRDINLGLKPTRFQAQQQAESNRLGGQVGQFSQLGLSEAPLQDTGQAITQGLVSSIPRALSMAGAGAAIGAAEGSFVVPGVGTVAGAAIGAAAGFASSMASSVISEFKGQRTDTINAQKRVLDEGKQTMNDWVTLAEADPANRSYYLNQFNQVAQQIDQAYRQMKFDTQRDVAQFEKALPDLAEFESFYANGGEFDVLNQDMKFALGAQAPPEYKMMELYQRRGGKWINIWECLSGYS